MIDQISKGDAAEESKQIVLDGLELVAKPTVVLPNAAIVAKEAATHSERPLHNLENVEDGDFVGGLG